MPAHERKSKPSNAALRRVAWLVSAMALFVAGHIAYNEVTYARLARHAIAVQAHITQIEVVWHGRRPDHLLHYEYNIGGRTFRFAERDEDRHARLDELYAATFNAFDKADPKLVVGGTFGVLVDPTRSEEHRPDRAKLPVAWLMHARDVLALLFLGAIAAWLFRRSKKR